MDEWDDFERSSSREDVFVLFRGDQNERVERKVRKSQITIERFSMMFHVSNSRISIFPEPTARSAVRRGLLIPLGYLHPGKCEHSEVQSHPPL